MTFLDLKNLLKFIKKKKKNCSKFTKKVLSFVSKQIPLWVNRVISQLEAVAQVKSDVRKVNK